MKEDRFQALTEKKKVDYGTMSKRNRSSKLDMNAKRTITTPKPSTSMLTTKALDKVPYNEMTKMSIKVSIVDRKAPHLHISAEHFIKIENGIVNEKDLAKESSTEYYCLTCRKDTLASSSVNLHWHSTS